MGVTRGGRGPSAGREVGVAGCGVGVGVARRWAWWAWPQYWAFNASSCTCVSRSVLPLQGTKMQLARDGHREATVQKVNFLQQRLVCSHRFVLLTLGQKQAQGSHRVSRDHGHPPSWSLRARPQGPGDPAILCTHTPSANKRGVCERHT